MMQNPSPLLTALVLTSLVGCASGPQQEHDAPSKASALSAASVKAPQVKKLLQLLVQRVEEPATLDLDETRRVLLELIDQRNEKALRILARCARDDPHEDVRLLALHAINRLESPYAAGVLMRASVNDPSQVVKRGAWEMLLADARAARR